MLGFMLHPISYRRLIAGNPHVLSQPAPSAIHFELPDLVGGMQDLPMEVGQFDGIAINKANSTHTSSSKICCSGTAQATNTDDKY